MTSGTLLAVLAFGGMTMTPRSSVPSSALKSTNFEGMRLRPLRSRDFQTTVQLPPVAQTDMAGGVVTLEKLSSKCLVSGEREMACQPDDGVSDVRSEPSSLIEKRCCSRSSSLLAAKKMVWPAGSTPSKCSTSQSPLVIWCSSLASDASGFAESKL